MFHMTRLEKDLQRALEELLGCSALKADKLGEDTILAIHGAALVLYDIEGKLR